jgi:hypothetical protein
VNIRFSERFASARSNVALGAGARCGTSTGAQALMVKEQCQSNRPIVLTIPVQKLPPTQNSDSFFQLGTAEKRLDLTSYNVDKSYNPIKSIRMLRAVQDHLSAYQG